ncbi:hypothetical protein [Paeniglutamicibacter sp.]|uniref:hypothetical protein n=1 Tax=Paeniglutamicibacter sp. TaxID=1934391 RepID=UPI003988C4F7
MKRLGLVSLTAAGMFIVSTVFIAAGGIGRFPERSEAGAADSNAEFFRVGDWLSRDWQCRPVARSRFQGGTRSTSHG